jgi:hypothetical protein
MSPHFAGSGGELLILDSFGLGAGGLFLGLGLRLGGAQSVDFYGQGIRLTLGLGQRVTQLLAFQSQALGGVVLNPAITHS